MAVAVVLGAGFSYVAGLPLAGGWFESEAQPLLRDDKDQERFDLVREARANYDGPAEQWLAELYAQQRDSDDAERLWASAVEFGLRQLCQVRNLTKSPYFYGITRNERPGVHEHHAAFWAEIFHRFSGEEIIVVTTNYDILAERALLYINNDGNLAPRFYYGGFPLPQLVRKQTNLAERKYDPVEMGTEVALYKLHGSVNWAVEPSNPESLKVHDDVRAVFRKREGTARPEIVPPIPEKEMPPRFVRVWNEAEQALGRSSTWVVCGYSMPEYDKALAAFFSRAASGTMADSVVLIDPNSDSLANRWSFGGKLNVTPLPGLPDALATWA